MISKSRGKTKTKYSKTNYPKGKFQKSKPTLQNKQTQNPSYMQEVQTWLEGGIHPPLKEAFYSQDEEAIEKAVYNATRAIKQRILASYHNGRKARQ